MATHISINNEYFELGNSPLGGQCLFAKKDIPKGTCILNRRSYCLFS